MFHLNRFNLHYMILLIFYKILKFILLNLFNLIIKLNHQNTFSNFFYIPFFFYLKLNIKLYNNIIN